MVGIGETGIISLLSLLFGWMPTGLQIVCAGVIGVFVTVVTLRIVKLIKDCIPFL